MNKNIKYGVVAALTLASFVAVPVGTASAYSTITVKNETTGKVETKYNYTEGDEINALKSGSLVFGAGHAAVLSRAYNGEALSAEDIYVKYTDNTTNATKYVQVSALMVGGVEPVVKFYAPTNTNGKVTAAVDLGNDDIAADATAAAGYYGVAVSFAGATLTAGTNVDESAPFAITKATVSGSTLTATAAEDKTLIFGDVESGVSDGFTAKIGSVTVDAADVKVFKTAADRAKFIEDNTDDRSIVDILDAGTYYTFYALHTDANVAYSGGIEGNTYNFLGTLTVAKANISSYFKVTADTLVVELAGDGAKNTFTFTPKTGVTIPGNLPFDKDYLYIEDTHAAGYNALKNSEEKAQYKVTYKNNTKVGTATATIEGMNNYTGTATVTFAVTGAALADATQLGALETVYTGSAVDLKTIEYGGTEYTTGFTVSYAGNHKNVADSGVKVTIKGDGSSIITPTEGLEATLTIKALDLGSLNLVTEAEWAKMPDLAKNADNYIVISSKAYNTAAPSVAIYAMGNKVATSVYTTTFEAATKAGQQATLTVKGAEAEVTAGNVIAGSQDFNWATTKTIDSAVVSGASEAYSYTGDSIVPVISAKMGSDTLVEGVDYVVSYKSNLKVGTGSIVLTGMGEYAGSTKTISFKINPAKASFKKATVGAKKVTVKASKGAGAAGIQIAYRVKGATKWTYKKTTKSSYTIKNLKKGKKYTISIRSYKKVGDTTYYSGWTTKTTKKVK